jgi:hypothetical protein
VCWEHVSDEGLWPWWQTWASIAQRPRAPWAEGQGPGSSEDKPTGCQLLDGHSTGNSEHKHLPFITRVT